MFQEGKQSSQELRWKRTPICTIWPFQICKSSVKLATSYDIGLSCLMRLMSSSHKSPPSLKTAMWVTHKGGFSWYVSKTDRNGICEHTWGVPGAAAAAAGCEAWCGPASPPVANGFPGGPWPCIHKSAVHQLSRRLSWHCQETVRVAASALLPHPSRMAGLAPNSILFCWLFKFKDRCKKVRFQQTHNHRFLLTGI